MILTFGYICMGIDITLEDAIGDTSPLKSQSSITSVNGRAALQAIAAARMGGKVSLVGCIGNDLFAQHILDVLRKDGIQTAGIIAQDTDTGLITKITDVKGEAKTILTRGANTQSSVEQIPDLSLNERTLLLLQDEFSAAMQLPLIERAKNKGARVMICCDDGGNIGALLPHVDMIVCKGELTLTITNEHTIVIQNEAIPRGAGCFDAFCGSVAACFQAGMSMPRTLEYAHTAAQLAAQKVGAYESLPYLGHVKEALEKSA